MTTLGWDMSHFDAPSIGNAIQQGIGFLTHKAGGDSASGDPELAAWWSNVKTTDPAKTLLGTYWVPRPDLYPDPAREAARWIGTIDGRCPGWRDRPHMLQMDAERWPAGDRTKPGRSYLQALGDRLVELAPKLRPICYASKGQYGDELTGLTFPLWNARYPTSATGDFKAMYAKVGGDRGPGWETYSGQTPAIWQYTSSATIGEQTTCDANAYRGELAALVALVAPGWKADDMNLKDTTGNQAYPGRDVEDFFGDMWKLRDVLWGDGAGTKVAALPSGSPLAKLITIPGQLAEVAAAVAALPTAKATADEVLAQLAGRPVPEIAAALKAVLGDRAAAVGAALQAE